MEESMDEFNPEGAVVEQSDYSSILDAVASSELPTTSRRCCIHVKHLKAGGVIKSLDAKSWAQIQSAADTRRRTKMFTTSKYKQVVDSLPDSMDETMGYHLKCYSSFTAVVKVSQPAKSVESNPMNTRSTTPSPKPNKSSAGLFARVCLYCEKEWKYRDGKKEGLSSICEMNAVKKIHEAAIIMKDSNILSKISGVDIIAKEAKVHNMCRAAVLASANRISSGMKKSILPQKQALYETFAYVQNHVLSNEKRPEFIKSIFARYEILCENFGEVQMSNTTYFSEVLQKKFQGLIQVTTPEAKKSGLIAHCTDIDYHSIKSVYDYKSSDEGLVTKVAMLLRGISKGVDAVTLSEPINVESLMLGEGDAPYILSRFFSVLYTGSVSEIGIAESVKRRIESSAADALYNVHCGKLKTKKHILLAMTIKSLTGSKKLLTILNRLGHSISYTKTEELETALATSILERDETCPPGVNRNSVVGLAFDNYDELTHTMSGHNSLHDTMGIVYCGENPAPAPTETVQQRRPATGGKGKMKRTLDVSLPDIQPYHKKPKMTIFAYDRTGTTSRDVQAIARARDILYLMAHATLPGVPMWLGFNAQGHVDVVGKQVVHYLPNLNLPITRTDVVAHTMRLALKCAQECEQAYALVTYDLDVAKVALRIQASEFDQYKNLFVMLGGFHIFICYFRALGRLIGDSGGPEILVDSGVLAPGSLRGFIECVAYNRCRRLHPMLALAFEILHFRRFLSDSENYVDVQAMTQTWDLQSPTGVDAAVNTQEFIELSDAYMQYRERSIQGALGETAKFWLSYCEYVNEYHILQRAIRNNDIDLYVATLSNIVDLFFATNRVNYSRWLCKYRLDLLNMDTTHPGLRRLLLGGGFSIRRSSNHFGRIPVDLTLEQTINADAASRLTGYTDSTNNYAARVRWAATKSARAAMVSELCAMTGVATREDCQAELHPGRIVKDNNDLQKIIDHISNTCNPFSLNDTQPLLINIATGKSASVAVSASLLSVRKDGADRHLEFIRDCQNDPDRFERPIKRHKLLTFSNDCVTNKKSPLGSKESELKCTSQLMGRLAFAAAKAAIDLEHVFSHPLTPVPLSLFKGDGTMNHTDKSKLMHILEGKAPSNVVPSNVHSTIIDGCFLLRTMNPNQPNTYGALSRNVLHTVLRHPSQRVDVIFDSYETPSIKDPERERRGGITESSIVISGPSQRREGSFTKQLNHQSIKRALPLFLAEDWSSDHYAPSLVGRDLYLGVMDKCYRYFEKDGKVCRESVDRLACNHPEADTRLIYHALEASETCTGDCVLRCNDTDIMVIVLYHLHKFPTNNTIWLDLGTAGQGNRRFVNVNRIGATIGLRMCESLIGLHSFTGTDFTSAFARKGKARPYTLSEKIPEFQSAFAQLSTGKVTDQLRSTLRKFVTVLYGSKKHATLNRYRYEQIEKCYSGDENAPFEKLKNIEGSSIPPSEAELDPHIDRCNFVACMWAAADKSILPKSPASGEFGWDLIDESYSFISFNGPQLPASLRPVIDMNEEETENDPSLANLEWDESDEDD